MTVLLLSVAGLFAQEQSAYQRPPKAIENLVLAPASPLVKMSPDNKSLAILQVSDIPTIKEQAMEELRLAGTRILASTNGPKMKTKIKGIEIKAMPGSKLPEGKVQGFPADVNILETSWSPDGSRMVALVEQEDGIRMWIVDASTLEAKELNHHPLNLFFGRDVYSWSPDGKNIIAPFIVENRGKQPDAADYPIVPVVQSCSGKGNPAPTYQDLLSDKFSETQFDYYATSILGVIDVETGKISYSGKPAIHDMVSYSPDGKYYLTERIFRPFSYSVPYDFFPATVEVRTPDGNVVKELSSRTLVESDYLDRNSTTKFPRAFSWRSDKPSTLFWVEPLDGGDGKAKVEYRDKLVICEAPFDSPKEIFKTKDRFNYILWGNDDNAFVTSTDNNTKIRLCERISPLLGKSLSVLYNQSREDLYGDMGSIITSNNTYGRQTVLTYDGFRTIFLEGNGYSPKGAYPFIDSYNLKSGRKTRLWQCADPYYEKPIAYLDLSKGLFVASRESNTEVPNYFLENLKKKKTVQLTDFADPYPEMQGVTKQVIEYTRKDGVKLSGTLYLPAGYKKDDGPLPVYIWAYPTEYKSRDNAGQRSDAPNQFIRYTRLSPVLFVAAGYAVLNNASFPIIGEGDKEPNDTYVEQLVANAAAAIDKLVEMGVGDRKRMAVGGHSYGAFMTANLLANCDLFAAGIARSGAYNRTLTPFGFQNEMRTLWEAPEVYLEMSPFMKADKLKSPLLMIHGLADDNTGTFTIQSERLFAAIKGNGGTARLVLLPYEAHGYVAKENLLETAAETYQWLEKYVKNRK
jgi:dipeptidyl aminopeptidase/acylaminoacyl peptidase